MTTFGITWFAEQIGKSPSWVYSHIDELPHHKIGRSVRFTEANLDDYLRATRRGGVRMATVSRRRSA